MRPEPPLLCATAVRCAQAQPPFLSDAEGLPFAIKTGSYFYLDKELQVVRLFLAFGTRLIDREVRSFFLNGLSGTHLTFWIRQGLTPTPLLPSAPRSQTLEDLPCRVEEC